MFKLNNDIIKVTESELKEKLIEQKPGTIHEYYLDVGGFFLEKFKIKKIMMNESEPKLIREESSDNYGKNLINDNVDTIKAKDYTHAYLIKSGKCKYKVISGKITTLVETGLFNRYRICDKYRIREICLMFKEDIEPAYDYLKNLHKRKVENYEKNQKILAFRKTFIEPSIHKRMEDAGLVFNTTNDKVFINHAFGDNAWITEAIENAFKEKFKDILEAYHITFKSNLKGLNIVRPLGTLKFDKNILERK